jgi:hypothetical protein
MWESKLGKIKKNYTSALKAKYARKFAIKKNFIT